MKRQLPLTILFLISSGLCLSKSSICSASDVQDVYDTHNAWISAFEQTDIAAVDALWTQTPDARLITIFGDEIKGWKKVRNVILTSFVLTQKTQITGDHLVITVSGDEASATMDYRWSVVPNELKKATELYRKVAGVWKMHAQDGTGKILQPLRPDDEIRLRAQVQEILDAITLADIDKLKPLVADNDFTSVTIDGTVHHGFSKAIVSEDLAKIQKVHLDVVCLTDEVATAHLTLTLVGNNEQKAQFIIKNFQLTKIDFAPKSLAVQPFGTLTTTWAKIKER